MIWYAQTIIRKNWIGTYIKMDDAKRDGERDMAGACDLWGLSPRALYGLCFGTCFFLISTHTLAILFTTKRQLTSTLAAWHLRCHYC